MKVPVSPAMDQGGQAQPQGDEPDQSALLMSAATMHSMGRLFEPKDKGLLEQGNIDLGNRPKVPAPEGGTSTVRSITVTDDDGKATLIPTVVGDKVVSNKEAIAHFNKTGEHLGKFSNEKDADDYAERLHKSQAKRYGLE